MLTRKVLLYLLFTLSLMACDTPLPVEIVFGGDVMLDRGIRQQIEANGFQALVKGIEPELNHADYAVVNLECPATDIKAPLHKQFVFRAEPAYLQGLRDAGVTHCIMANNHAYDQGRPGLISTAENLGKANLVPIGYGQTQQDACMPVVIQHGGVKAAIFSSVTLRLESWMYLEKEPGMCQATVQQLTEAVAVYRKEHPNTFIIVTLHWGIEYQTAPSRTQQTQARDLIHAGADAIIGHHPHVVQTMEHINGKPVFYSLGNLIFDNRHPLAQEGILIKLALQRNRKPKFTVLPYRIDHGKPVLIGGSAKTEALSRLQTLH